MLKWLIVALVVVFVGVSIALLWQPSLKSIHKDIRKDLGSVQHMSADDFEQRDHASMVVFDVREEDEFDVSRIDGAIQISPSMDSHAFMTLYGDLLKDKKAVFYCSVGRRSSDLVARLQADSKTSDLNSDLYNLEGGLFNWVNQQRPIVGQGIHPYNAYWGRLIKDANQIRYQADQ